MQNYKILSKSNPYPATTVNPVSEFSFWEKVLLIHFLIKLFSVLFILSQVNFIKWNWKAE